MPELSRIGILQASIVLFLIQIVFNKKCNGRKALNRKKNGTIQALWLNLTKACNLRCAYCFTSNLTALPEMMSKQTAESCVEFLIREALSDESGLRERTLVFFGGEPLLRWEIILHTVGYINSRTSHLPVSFKYMLATNGTLLNEEHAKFLARHDISVQISLDGPEEIHNRVRKTASGKGSYKATIKGVELMQKWLPEKNFSVRPTVTEHGPSLLELSRFFTRLGVKRIFLKNIIPQSRDSEPGIFDWLEQQKNEKDRLAKFVIAAYWDGINIYPMISNANKLINGFRPESACSAGACILSITPDGRVFPCHRYEEDNNMVLSDKLSGVTEKSRTIYWQTMNNTLDECSRCWANHFCEKGCPASNHFAGFDGCGFLESFCETKKFEAKVSLKTALLLLEQACEERFETEMS